MKIVQPDHIQRCEDFMFSSLKQKLNMETALAALMEGADSDQIDISHGKLVPSGNEVTYHMDLSVTLSKRLIFDREGNLLNASPKVPDIKKIEPHERTLGDIFQENRDFWEDQK